MRISLLGGSSPFTVAFIDALNEIISDNDRLEIIFHGRNERILQALVTYAEWRHKAKNLLFEFTTDINKAIVSSEVLIVQIRYGGLALRRASEWLAEQAGCSADETLGPAALYSVIAQAEELRKLGRHIKQNNSNALVVNMINPLSISTKIFAQEGLHVIGICEAPLEIIHRLNKTFDLSNDALYWQYVGLNHRGFIYDIKTQIEGVTKKPQEFKSLDLMLLKKFGYDNELMAIPSKQFELIRDPISHGIGRSDVLDNIRKQVADELISNPTRKPQSLQRRDTPWYPLAVIPLINALRGDKTWNGILNIDCGDIVVERRVKVNKMDFKVMSPTDVPPYVEKWMNKFIEHELASLAAVETPTLYNIKTALAVDPIMTKTKLDEISKLLTEEITQRLATDRAAGH